MDLTLNDAVLGVELSGIRRFTVLVRNTPGACRGHHSHAGLQPL